jgi:hypothetical protein
MKSRRKSPFEEPRRAETLTSVAIIYRAPHPTSPTKGFLYRSKNIE